MPENVEIFQSSMFAVAKEVQLYLQKLLSDPFNKYCIDCKINKSTHSIIYYGTFVCEQCANEHRNLFGFRNTYPKLVVGEHWDDFQLMSVAKGFGGNKPLFNLFKEFGIENESIKEKYESKAF